MQSEPNTGDPSTVRPSEPLLTPEEYAIQAAKKFLDTGKMNDDDIRAVCNTLVTYMQLHKETKLYADNLFEKIVSYCKKPVDAAHECLINLGRHDAASGKIIIDPKELDEIADTIRKDMEETIWLDLKAIISRDAKVSAYDQAVKTARSVGTSLGKSNITGITKINPWNTNDLYLESKDLYFNVSDPKHKTVLEEMIKQFKISSTTLTWD